MELLIFAILVSIFGFWSIVSDIAKGIGVLILIIGIVYAFSDPAFRIYCYSLLGICIVYLVVSVIYGLVTLKSPTSKEIVELQSTKLHYNDIAPYIPPQRQHFVEQFLANAEPDDSLEITVSISESDAKKLSKFLNQ